ncbi:Fur family transcriptional regulator [Trichloromonas sp.]|uniref:Fur family transcriptional regulator n=1 Tax=Trichloromonas sp. TaxID=3069249 RepID=UPI002A4C7022|nr:transcriptional repressor [Trichloromonas sp.]
MQEKKRIFRDCLSERGLKWTSQREVILDAFLRCDSHPSTEDLYLKLRKKHPNIGYATVYRTLKLFSECGIAASRDFGDGQTRYESTSEAEHHDHLICKDCGAIVEFEDPRIEALQEEIARQHGYVLLTHRHEIFGRCPACQKKLG